MYSKADRASHRHRPETHDSTWLRVLSSAAGGHVSHMCSATVPDDGAGREGHEGSSIVAARDGIRDIDERRVRNCVTSGS